MCNNSFFDKIISCFFPKRCKYCGKVIDLRHSICIKCANNLQRISGKVCFKCGVEKDFCICKGRSNFYKSIISPFYYEGAIHNTIWQLKFRGMKELSMVIAEDMANCFFEHYGEYKFDYCTFVPSHKSSLKERGYNHAELITKDLSELINVECVSLLEKLYKTKPQHLLSEIERTGNLTGAFALKDNIDIENKRILLCDDVKTTGSTLNECAKTLLIGGAAEVLCLTGAIAIPRKNSEEKNSLL